MKPALVVLAVVALAVGAAPVSRDGAATAVSDAPPRAGLVGRCHIVEVYDGDTLTVEFSVHTRVRLLDCWADEVRTTDENEKARGIEARNHLGRLCGLEWDGKHWTGRTPATLLAPFGESGTLGNLFTLERLLARVWIERGELASLQREAGHAAATKEELAERNRRRGGQN